MSLCPSPRSSEVTADSRSTTVQCQYPDGVGASGSTQGSRYPWVPGGAVPWVQPGAVGQVGAGQRHRRKLGEQLAGVRGAWALQVHGCLLRFVVGRCMPSLRRVSGVDREGPPSFTVRTDVLQVRGCRYPSVL